MVSKTTTDRSIKKDKITPKLKKVSSKTAPSKQAISKAKRSNPKINTITMSNLKQNKKIKQSIEKANNQRVLSTKVQRKESVGNKQNQTQLPKKIQTSKKSTAKAVTVTQVKCQRMPVKNATKPYKPATYLLNHLIANQSDNCKIGSEELRIFKQLSQPLNNYKKTDLLGEILKDYTTTITQISEILQKPLFTVINSLAIALTWEPDKSHLEKLPKILNLNEYREIFKGNDAPLLSYFANVFKTLLKRDDKDN